MVFAWCMMLIVSLSTPLPAYVAAVAAPERAGAEEATTAEEVVAAYLEAIGGADAVRAVRSKQITYRVHMLGRDPYVMERTWTRPGGLRTGRPGADTYTLTEGAKSWSVGPEGRTELPPDVAASMSKDADIDGPFVDAEKKGVTLVYSGQVRYDMTVLHQVTVTFPDDVQWEYFFDAGSGLLRKMTRPAFYMLNGKISRGPDTHTYFYDYRSAGRVLYAHAWVQESENHTHLFVVESIQARE